MTGSFRELKVYKLSFEAARQIRLISMKFPKEETYSLTDQIRRSSRSVCVNIGEGYRKRIYPKHFSSKMTDADGKQRKPLSGWILPLIANTSISKHTRLCKINTMKLEGC
jgi:hypothetical protein